MLSEEKNEGISLVWPHSKDAETTKKLQFYHDLDTKTRGSFLIQANWVENDLDSLLSFLFCGNDENQRNLLKSTILKRTTFDTKSQVLLQILRLKKPDLVEKYGNLKGKLDSVRNFRNKWAHASLYIDNEFIKKDPKDRILIKIFEDGKETHPEILVKDVEDKLVLASEVIMIFGKLYSDLRNPEDSK